MNTKLKLVLLAIFSILIISISVSFLNTRAIKHRLPKPFIGNWINKENNKWQFGFFEEFVIFDNDFWKYKEIKEHTNGAIDIVLTKQNKTLGLHLERGLKNQLSIKQDGKPESDYVLMMDNYPDYRTLDHNTFAKPSFTGDSVTIIGYYRNLDKGIKGFVQRFFRSPFEVSIADFLTGEEVKYYGDIDDLGRFKVTFPVMNTQELYVDWKRTRIRAVVEPRDTLFLFADIEDYLPKEEDGKNYHTYVDRPKEVLFMGRNARLNNELRQYNSPSIAIDKGSMTGLDDMQYLHKCEEVYQNRLASLSQHIERHPGISDKFVKYKQIEEKYDFASNLMQHRFDLSGREDPVFQQGYLEYIKENFPLSDEMNYTMTRYFGRFLSDYLGYISGNSVTNVLFSEIGKRLDGEGKLSSNLAKQIAEIDSLSRNRGSVGNNTKLEAELNSRSDKLNADPLIRKTAEMLQSENNFLDTRIADSMLHNQNLRELWLTNRYNYWFEVLRKPLSAQKLSVFRENVNNPYLINQIEQKQAHYGLVANEGKTYQANQTSTDQLKDSENADKLLQELLKPYKGKVVYIDFWGTWCSPCRKDLKMVGILKQKVASKDVIFLYFANRSPEDTWRNLIQELHLTGDNVVHHRLPDEQQAMLERKLGVTTFPTYMLVNKEGVIVNRKASSPTNFDYTASTIKDLL